jgi:hypothetical protein
MLAISSALSRDDSVTLLSYKSLEFKPYDLTLWRGGTYLTVFVGCFFFSYFEYEDASI